MDHPLDDMIWGALHGAHHALALRRDAAVRYPDGMPPFAALRGEPVAALEELASLMAPDAAVALTSPLPDPLPTGWKTLGEIRLIQMVCEGSIAPPEVMPELLSADDVPEMLALVEATQPGPFGPRSIELGRYVGYRSEQGALLAMAGERLRPPGYTEVSAVCTHPDARRKGLGEAATRGIAAVAQRRGEVPFLHLEASKSDVLVPFYERLGFARRRALTLRILQWSSDTPQA